MAHSRSIPVLVDGAQSAGALPRAIHDLEVDYYAVSGHKWLCGPQGTGALYVSRKAVVPLGMSYGGVYSDAEHGAGGRLAPFNAAQRHEVSTRNYPALAGQAAGIRWMLDEVGIEWACERSRSLVEHCRKLLVSIPEVDVITPANHVGLIGFTIPGGAEAAADWLDARGVWCRSIRQPELVRLSIGFYTTEDEIAQVAALIEERVHEGVRV
jgi:L-cysteine/cystine lyase